MTAAGAGSVGGRAFEDKVALVTGGASGIGLATARRLASGGARVAILDVDTAGGEAAASELGGLFVRLDVAEPSAWGPAVQEVEEALGGVDYAFLNAGVAGGTEDITKLTDAGYDHMVGINLDGVVFGVRAVVPSMARRGGGAIVATSSLAGLVAFSLDPVYTLTKHAVVGLVRALGEQLARKRITINAVCPGLTDTPLLGEGGRERLEAANFAVIPAEQIAEAAVGRMLGVETGSAWVCQAGIEAVEYHFRRVPGPRVEGREPAPPGQLRGSDQ